MQTPTPLNPGGHFPHLTFFRTFTITCLQSQECSFPRDFSLFYYDQWQRAFVRGVHNSLLLASKWTFQLHIWSTSISSSLTESYSERKPSTSTSKGGNIVILSFFFSISCPKMFCRLSTLGLCIPAFWHPLAPFRILYVGTDVSNWRVHNTALNNIPSSLENYFSFTPTSSFKK